MTTETTDTHSPSLANTPLALKLTEGLGALLDGWANVEGVRFVSRSYGQRTTDTVSRDGLLDLMRAVQAAERERFAELREVSRAFYNATVGQPGLRLTTADEAMRDAAKDAGECLRALLVASWPNV